MFVAQQWEAGLLILADAQPGIPACAMLDAMHRRKFIAMPLIGSLSGHRRIARAAGTDNGQIVRPGGEVAATTGAGEPAMGFPVDFGAHPQTRIEWWYVTGALAVDGRGDGPHFGFQLTFFRLRTGVSFDHPSRFAARQIVFAHAALSVLAQRQLRHDQRASRAGFEIAEAKTGDTDVWLREWRLKREGNAEASRYRARLASSAGGFAIDLQLNADRAPLLQGAGGLSQKGPDPAQTSHYYSQPQLQTVGHVTLDGKQLPVRGTAWLDHEWSDNLLPADAVGWDWIGINLSDGGALTAFRVRRADTSAVFAGGSWQSAQGQVRNFAPAEVQFRPLRGWLSPRTQARYPVEWEVTTPAGAFRVAAMFDDQELDSRQSTGSVYWEGLSTLRDSSGRLVGRGYLEMTGYAGPMQL